MTYEFKLPDIGEGLHEAEIVRWFVSVGDAIEADELIAEVQTDKAVVEMTSPVGGKVVALAGEEGSVVKVGETLITLDRQGDNTSERSVTTEESEPKQSIVDREQKAEQPKEFSPHNDNRLGRVVAAPIVRKRARELGINIADVTGTAKGGRITLEDVENYVENRSKKTDEDTIGEHSQPLLDQSVFSDEKDEHVPVRGLRKKIAEKMVQSKNVIPHVTGMDEIDVTKLVSVRKQLNEQLDSEVTLTYLPFIIKAVTRALKEYPYFNATYDESKDEIILKKRMNIGIATATKQGLVVPVIKNADQKSLIEIAIELKELVEKAHEQKLALTEIQDGTFTITSTGMNGGWFATPIINHPEVAIFGAHAIKKRPVVIDDEIVAREMMGISMTFDHRIIDGEPAGRFMQTVSQVLQNPEILLLDVK